MLVYGGLIKRRFPYEDLIDTMAAEAAVAAARA